MHRAKTDTKLSPSKIFFPILRSLLLSPVYLFVYKCLSIILYSYLVRRPFALLLSRASAHEYCQICCWTVMSFIPKTGLSLKLMSRHELSSNSSQDIVQCLLRRYIHCPSYSNNLELVI